MLMLLKQANTYYKNNNSDLFIDIAKYSASRQYSERPYLSK